MAVIEQNEDEPLYPLLNPVCIDGQLLFFIALADFVSLRVITFLVPVILLGKQPSKRFDGSRRRSLMCSPSRSCPPGWNWLWRHTMISCTPRDRSVKVRKMWSLASRVSLISAQSVRKEPRQVMSSCASFAMVHFARFWRQCWCGLERKLYLRCFYFIPCVCLTWVP